jgi:excisionase family DNA binding protein
MAVIASFPASLLTPQEAADYLRTGVRTLERWRHAGGGPTFVKIGRRVTYRIADLQTWVEAQRREHTSATAAAR